MNKITINFGSPFGSLTIISSSERQWAQQGSNLRPLACKARTYRRWTWLDVARCGICQPRLWLDVAWRGLVSVVVGSPFGSPISLAPLNFNKHEPCLKLVTAPATATPGAIDAWRSPRPPELDVGATGGIGAL